MHCTLFFVAHSWWCSSSGRSPVAGRVPLEDPAGECAVLAKIRLVERKLGITLHHPKLGGDGCPACHVPSSGFFATQLTGFGVRKHCFADLGTQPEHK